MTDDNKELNERLKALGMFTLDEMLDDKISGLGIFDTHKNVHTIEQFAEWVEMKRKEFTTMRLKYEVGMSEKDDLYEWVLSHSATFSTISKHLRKIMPSLQKERDELKSALSVLLEKYLELACGDSYGGVEYVESEDEDAIRARKALKER